jgi:hypothetical protein
MKKAKFFSSFSFQILNTAGPKRVSILQAGNPQVTICRKTFGEYGTTGKSAADLGRGRRRVG